jgi:hypothetical protein
MINNELVNYQDKLYSVYRKIKSSQVKENHIQDLKEFWDCDIVVKSKINNDDILYFMREIPELEVL